jgi:sugar (pentulose or hexulose) kinase
VKVVGRTQPDGRNRAAYTAAYDRYRELYPALKPTFDRL